MKATPVAPTKRPRVAMQFGPPGMNPIVHESATEIAQAGALAKVEAQKVEKPRREAAKCDPTMIAAARELRDRWLEHVNAGAPAPTLAIAGKYDVTRGEFAEARPRLASATVIDAGQPIGAMLRLLPAA